MRNIIELGSHGKPQIDRTDFGDVLGRIVAKSIESQVRRRELAAEAKPTMSFFSRLSKRRRRDERPGFNTMT
jgi:hypothetical protein